MQNLSHPTGVSVTLSALVLLNSALLRPLAAIRSCCRARDSFAFVFVDESLGEKFPCPFRHALDIFAVVLPWPFAGTELCDAATLRVHDCARGSIRALVAIVGHAIAVIVARQTVGTQFEDPSIHQ